MELRFHRLVQRDLNEALRWYEREGGSGVADRFFAEAEAMLAGIDRQPLRHHLIGPGLRRANFPTFPFHFIYRVSPLGIRVLVLRHHRRRPGHGLSRR